jgi:hypothetical protein
MKKITLLLAFLAFQAFANAQNESLEVRKKLALEIISTQNETMDLPKLFTNIAKLTSQQTAALLRSKNKELSEVQLNRSSQLLENAIAGEMQEMVSQIQPKIVDAALALYLRSFNLEEMQELHRFYLSPVGKKVMGTTMQELPNLMTTIMPDASVVGQKIATALQKAYAQLDSEGIKLRK